jgi:hypothetical protein
MQLGDRVQIAITRLILLRKVGLSQMRFELILVVKQTSAQPALHSRDLFMHLLDMRLHSVFVLIGSATHRTAAGLTALLMHLADMLFESLRCEKLSLAAWTGEIGTWDAWVGVEEGLHIAFQVEIG